MVGILLALGALFAHPVTVSSIYAGTNVLIQLLFTRLLAGWAVWIGIAVSTRTTDVRAAQQLSMLGSVPPLAILVLMSLNVITVSTAPPSVSPQRSWPSICAPGASWPQCSTVNDSWPTTVGDRSARVTPSAQRKHHVPTGGDQACPQR